MPHIPENAEFPILFLLLFLPSYLAQQPMPRGIFDSPAFLLQILIQSLLILFLTLYMLRKNPPPEELSKTALASEIEIGSILAVITGLGALFLLYNGLLQIIQITGYRQLQEEPVLLTKGFMLLPALVICLCAATMEEFFFRGYGYFRMRQTGAGEVPSLIMINILFAAGHIYEGLPAAGFAFASGIFLSLALRRGVSLFSLSAAHGIFNFIMILISYLS